MDKSAGGGEGPEGVSTHLVLGGRFVPGEVLCE
jgi:hypothetical protein